MYDLNEMHLTDIQIADKRKKAVKMAKSRKLLRELIFNFVFLTTLFVVSYTNKDLNSFSYKNSLETLFLTHFDLVIIFFLKYL
jgi:hypothetical protein